MSTSMPHARRELGGWDAIGGYLGITGRAAQEQERKNGLPVYRRPGQKGRVFAYTDELDAWKRSPTPASTDNDGRTGAPASAQSPPAGSVDCAVPTNQETVIAEDREQRSSAANQSVFRRYRLAGHRLLGTVGVITALMAALTWMQPWRRAEASAIKIVGKTLVALDAASQPVWQYVLPGTPEEPITWGQAKRVFADIDGDGKPELIYPFRDLDHPHEPDTLFCFSPTGRLLWKRQIGRDLRMASSTTVYPAHYNLVWIGALRKATPQGGVVIAGGRRGGTMVFCVELLDKDGNLISDYYHLGWLWAMATLDLDSDGYDEVVMGGVNNLYASMPGFGYSMTLLILDSREISGQGPSPEDGRRLAGLKTGSERAVLFLPDFYKTSSEHPERFCLINAFDPLPGGRFKVRGIFNNGTQDIYTEYQFDQQLRLEIVQPSAMVRQLLDSQRKPATAWERADYYKKELGKILILKNDFMSTQR